jgi:phosphatidylserine decarboxylase
VHVNRVPAAGTVRYLEYVPGKYVVAFADKAAEINERNYIGLETNVGRVLMCQIAGFVARRIVCWRGPGDKMDKGERFGLIKFGSCVQVWLPPGVVATVQPGERVYAGATVIGRTDNEA